MKGTVWSQAFNLKSHWGDIHSELSYEAMRDKFCNGGDTEDVEINLSIEKILRFHDLNR